MTERHGTCPDCFRGVHEYPKGWQHTQTSPGQPHRHPMQVRIPAADVRPSDEVARSTATDAWIVSRET